MLFNLSCFVNAAGSVFKLLLLIFITVFYYLHSLNCGKCGFSLFNILFKKGSTSFK